MGFRMTVRTTTSNETFKFPMISTGNTVNCQIDWGDGNSDIITSFNDPLLTHEYVTSGDHDIEITSGTWTAPYFNSIGDKDKVIEIKEWGTGYGTSWNNAFRGCSNLTVSASDVFGTSIIRMENMFQNCSSLTALDVSAWDVSSVEQMEYMFQNCLLLSALDVSAWNTGSVKRIDRMFQGCTSLTTLDVSSWDVSLVTNTSYMFSNCTSLVGLDPSTWNVSNVTRMEYMFNNCSSLTTLDLDSWDVSSVINMTYMFYDCSGLIELHVSGWNVSNIGSTTYMFRGCSSLVVLDVRDWDFSSVTHMDQMFRYCSSLTTLDVSQWDVSSVLMMTYMFDGCSSLTTIDMSAWDVSSVTHMSFMLRASGFSDASYDAALSGWSKLTLNNGVNFHAGTAKYALANERAVLTDTFGWNITDGGPHELDYLVDGFLWYAEDDIVYLSDGLNITNLLDLDPEKIGIAYGDGQMRLTVDGVNSVEVDYDGGLLVGILDIFRGATDTLKMRNLQRYDGTYMDAKSKIDQLMT